MNPTGELTQAEIFQALEAIWLAGEIEVLRVECARYQFFTCRLCERPMLRQWRIPGCCCCSEECHDGILAPGGPGHRS